jgi:hypothetical protein
MRSGHEEIMELLPEYLMDTLPGDMRGKVESHVKDCRDCRDEMAFLTEIVNVEAPDPGDLFWNTLPRKVKLTVAEKQQAFSLKYLFGGLPVAAVAALLLLSLISTPVQRKDMAAQDIIFKDPLTASVLDYGDITEKDIPQITAPFTNDALYLPLENFTGHSYDREVASLSSKEVENLYEALERERRMGG